MLQKYGNQIGGFEYNASELIVTYLNGSTISLFGSENPDSLRGLDLRWVIFDEYAQQPSWIYSEIIFPMINANNWWVTWIGTPKGKNSFFKLYQRAIKDDRFYTTLLRHTQTGLLSEEQISDARKEMTEEEFEQEYNCSWDAHIAGAVYGKELALAYTENRIRKDIYDPSLPVTTFWDLGISDAMAILFVQNVGKEIRIIDAYKNSGFGLEHYANVLQSKPYKYATHYFPHDIRNRELGTGTSRIEVAIKLLGKDCKIVPNNTIESGINAGRLIFKNLWVNEDLDDFLNDLSLYRYEYNEKLWEFSKTPQHDFTSHFADTYRYLATIYDFFTKLPEKKEETVVFDEMSLLIDDDEYDEKDETYNSPY